MIILIDKHIDMDFIRKRIIELEKSSNLSERKLSIELGYNPSYLKEIKSGRSKPSLEALLNICDFFEITLFEFFYSDMNNPITSKKIYDELIRLSNNNLDKFLFILETMKPEDFNAFINLIDRITIKRWKN